MECSRRQVMWSAAGVLATSVAGCLGDTDDGNDSSVEAADEPFDEVGVATFELRDRSEDPPTELPYLHDDHWHGSLPVIPTDDYLSVGAHVVDENGDELELGDDYELRAANTPGAEVDVLSFAYHGDHVHLQGEGEEGVTEIAFLLWHDDHSDYQTPGIPVQIGEDSETDDDESNHDDSHDH